MKKVFALIVILTISMGLPVCAKEGDGVINNDIVIIREDVSHEEALHDSTYDATQKSTYPERTKSRSVSWNVWGERVAGTNGGVWGYTPVGYSEHLDGTTVLETYHYTRTYLGKIAKKGDSGRRWGKYTFKATGTFCDEDVNMQYTQIVKYGTEDN